MNTLVAEESTPPAPDALDRLLERSACRVTSVTITVGKTVNTGNYNSFRMDYSATAEIAEDEDPRLITDALCQRAHTELESRVDALIAYQRNNQTRRLAES